MRSSAWRRSRWRAAAPPLPTLLACILIGLLPAQAPVQAPAPPATPAPAPEPQDPKPGQQPQAAPDPNPVPEPRALDTERIGRALQELLANPALAGGRIGVDVRDLAGDAALAAHDADKGFLTASNMKLVSAAVALKTLGPEFTWTTRVVGDLKDDLVDGDLFLVGSGDPSLGGRPGSDAMLPMRELADQLHARGVRRVRGGVVGDGSAHALPPWGSGWQWDYLDEDYAAPCTGLNFAENVMRLAVAGGEVGGAPRLRWTPEVAGPLLGAVDVRIGAAGSTTRLRVAAAPGQPAVVSGTIAADAQEQQLRLAVADAPRFAAQALHTAVAARGIALPPAFDVRAGAAPAGARTLAEIRSPPLREVLVPALEHSINLYSEQFWRTAAVQAAGARTHADCERHAKAVLQQLSVPTDGMVLADGSGLSRRDLVQPRQFTALLAAVHRDPELAPLAAALPVAGQSGTLRSRFRTGAARGRVAAKTGFVSFVVALSGYVPRPDGRPPLAFSVLLNNFTCDDTAAKAAVDAFVEHLAGAVGWTEAAASAATPGTSGPERRDRE